MLYKSIYLLQRKDGKNFTLQGKEKYQTMENDLALIPSDLPSQYQFSGLPNVREFLIMNINKIESIMN